MGLLVTKILKQNFDESSLKILILGLKGSGKTSMLYSLNLNKIEKIPFGTKSSLEILKHKNLSFICLEAEDFYDAIDQVNFNYFKGFVFVLDVSDEENIGKNTDAIEYLIKVKNKEDLPLLVFANKADKEDKFFPVFSQGVFKDLKLNENKGFLFQSCSALTKHGVLEGLEWLATRISTKGL